MNTKQLGNIGVGVAISYFLSKGYVVSIPLNDSQSYDIVVDTGVSLSRVQIKYTSTKQPSGFPVVYLHSTSGSSRKCYRRVNKENCDLLFVTTETGDKWCIPTTEITVTSALTLNSQMEKYRV